jgi:hypothetical protein
VHRATAVMLTVTLIPVGGWYAGAWHASSSARERFTAAPASRSPQATPRSDSGWSSLPVPLIEESEPDSERDLYGNDVSDAVAKYKHDRTGNIVEEHSPSTEIAKPKPPTT